MEDLSETQYWGIQHAHNRTGGITRLFETQHSAEATINPGYAGVTFFRQTGSDNLQQQVSSFSNVDKILQDIGGLKGVIFLDENLERSIEAMQTLKEHSQDIQTILLMSPIQNKLREEGLFSEAVDESVIDTIVQNQGNFVASQEGTEFWTYYQKGESAISSLKSNFKSVACVDTIICTQGGPTADQILATMHEMPKPVKKDLSRFSNSLLDSYPALKNWEL